MSPISRNTVTTQPKAEWEASAEVTQAGGLGLWQGALRDPSEPLYGEFHEALRERRIVTIDVLYSDMHGGQRTVSRFSVQPVSDDRWVTAVVRHWIIDGESPR